MKKQLENIIVENAKKYFKESGKYNISDTGGVDFEIYTDYNDEVNSGTIEEAFKLHGDNIEKVREYLYEHIFDCFTDYICDTEHEICKEVADYLERVLDVETTEKLENESMLDNSEIREILMGYDLLNIYVDYDDILARSNIDLIISLENKVSVNYEFSLNNFNGNVLEWIEETENALNDGDFERADISMIPLLESQGYSFETFKHEAVNYFNKDNYKPKSKFIQSLINECYNTTSMCNALVFLKQVNLNDYLNGDDGLKVIKKGTPCGYVDFVYGGGATIDIVLEKDIILSDLKHEKFVDGNKYGYSFRSIYGEFIH